VANFQPTSQRRLADSKEELPMSVGSTLTDTPTYRSVLGHFPTGVTAITAVAPDGRPIGMSVNSFSSVSLDPPLVAFCAGKSSTSWPAIAAVGRFCVNVLAEDQETVCRQISGKGDKFAGIGWRLSSGGAPLLDGVLAWLDCSIHAVYDAGDHEICLGVVHELAVARDSGPLLFFRGSYGRYAG